jgi:hypothetical protein
MGRHKSPFGPVRKLYLRYRVDDPRYQALHARIQEIPEGERNVALLDILGAGLATQAGVSAPKTQADTPPNRQFGAVRAARRARARVWAWGAESA